MTPFSGETTQFIDVADRTLRYLRIGSELSGAPIVFLHEGLGSVELWRRFPHDVVAATGRPSLVYSRYGNGWSAPLDEPRRPDYMHEEALHVLPRIVDRLVGRPPILVGHSDGASIAIIYAGSAHPVEALVLLAPHVFVEPETLKSIGSMRDGFTESDMAGRMEKYHTDPVRTFNGWTDVWLGPAFRSWNIEEYLPGVRSPTLLIQGDADEYGTTRQLDAIEAGIAVPPRRLIVEDAGHSPHLSHAELVTDAVAGFVTGLA